MSDFLEDHAPTIVVLAFLLAVGAYVSMTGLLSPSSNPKNVAQGVPIPTASLTDQAFPTAGETVTQSHQVRRKDGSIATRTIREYRDAQNRSSGRQSESPSPA